MDAIDHDVYDVIPIGITQQGRWVLETRDVDALRLSAGHTPEVDPSSDAVAISNDPSKPPELVTYEAGDTPRALGEVDVVLPLLHGPFGEDGTLQGMFEMSGIRYVGSGVLASAAAMDKHYMKVVLQGAGLPTPPHVTITDRLWRHDPAAAREAVHGLGLPVFVKPARAGSSMGISKVDRVEDLDAAIEEAREHDPKVVVEPGLLGVREVECAVLQNLDGSASASPVAEIVAYGDHAFYDFEAKYLAEEGVRLDVPADLPEHVITQVQELAVKTFEAFECEALARVDFFITADMRVMVNELNTMPGFTPTSMYPRLWAEAGVPYPELVDRLIQLALQRRVGLR